MKSKSTVSSPRVPLIALSLTAVVAWCRAGIYALQRDEVRATVATSTRVAEKNRWFVAEAQDALQWAWWGFPLVLLLLAGVVLALRIGQYPLVLLTGMAGPTLGVAGLLLPSNLLLSTLAVVFLVTLVWGVTTTLRWSIR